MKFSGAAIVLLLTAADAYTSTTARARQAFNQRRAFVQQHVYQQQAFARNAPASSTVLQMASVETQKPKNNKDNSTDVFLSQVSMSFSTIEDGAQDDAVDTDDFLASIMGEDQLGFADQMVAVAKEAAEEAEVASKGFGKSMPKKRHKKDAQKSKNREPVVVSKEPAAVKNSTLPAWLQKDSEGHKEEPVAFVPKPKGTQKKAPVKAAKDTKIKVSNRSEKPISKKEALKTTVEVTHPSNDTKKQTLEEEERKAPQKDTKAVKKELVAASVTEATEAAESSKTQQKDSNIPNKEPVMGNAPTAAPAKKTETKPKKEEAVTNNYNAPPEDTKKEAKKQAETLALSDQVSHEAKVNSAPVVSSTIPLDVPSAEDTAPEASSVKPAETTAVPQKKESMERFFAKAQLQKVKVPSIPIKPPKELLEGVDAINSKTAVSSSIATLNTRVQDAGVDKALTFAKHGATVLFKGLSWAAKESVQLVQKTKENVPEETLKGGAAALAQGISFITKESLVLANKTLESLPNTKVGRSNTTYDEALQKIEKAGTGIAKLAFGLGSIALEAVSQLDLDQMRADADAIVSRVATQMDSIDVAPNEAQKTFKLGRANSVSVPEEASQKEKKASPFFATDTPLQLDSKFIGDLVKKSFASAKDIASQKSSRVPPSEVEDKAEDVSKLAEDSFDSMQDLDTLVAQSKSSTVESDTSVPIRPRPPSVQPSIDNFLPEGQLGFFASKPKNKI